MWYLHLLWMFCSLSEQTRERADAPCLFFQLNSSSEQSRTWHLFIAFDCSANYCVNTNNTKLKWNKCEKFQPLNWSKANCVISEYGCWQTTAKWASVGCFCVALQQLGSVCDGHSWAWRAGALPTSAFSPVSQEPCSTGQRRPQTLWEVTAVRLGPDKL